MSWHAAQVGFVVTGLVAIVATLALSVRIVATTARNHRWARRG